MYELERNFIFFDEWERKKSASKYAVEEQKGEMIRMVHTQFSMRSLQEHFLSASRHVVLIGFFCAEFMLYIYFYKIDCCHGTGVNES